MAARVNDVFETGTLIDLRGRHWLLTRAQHFGECRVLSLAGRDGHNTADRLSVILPFDRPRRSSQARLKQRRRRAVLRHAFNALHTCRRAGSLWTAATATIDLHSYQLEPALAALAGSTRLLLADAVGLGKTIQAGLLVSELLRRGWIERALIVCPSGLRETWQRELRDRFAITSHVLDQRALADRVALFPPGVNPWSIDGVAIASIDFVKRDEVLAALDQVPIDLIVADEAHHLAPGTDRGAAVSRLASRAVWCVFVSATPHSGDRDAFEYLRSIGQHGDALAIFRRSRADVGLANVRRERFLGIRGTAEERSMLEAIGAYSRLIWHARGRSDHAARLVAITIARRAASSAAAVERTLSRRLELVGSAPAVDVQPALPWDESDERDDLDADSILAAPGLDDVTAERDALAHLIELCRQCASASKIVRLARFLDRLDEPAIVFTEYRDTLDVIRRSIAPHRRVAVIHGGMTIDARAAVVDAFNRGANGVLVATDAAGEGLNLHHRCRLVIDFELPWNPLRLEQRIGRVDRLGQQRTVHAIRLFHSGSIEEQVLERLSLRRREASLGFEHAISEQDAAAGVFEDAALPARDLPRLDHRRVAGVESEFDRVLAQRRNHAVAGALRSWSSSRSRRTRFVFLHRSSFFNEHGLFVADQLHAHEAQCAGSKASLVTVGARISRLLRDNVPADEHGRHAAREIVRRITAIRRRIARDQRREYQRSLFDGRADADRAEREQSAARIERALTRIEHAVAPSSPPHTRIEMVAAWPRVRQ